MYYLCEKYYKSITVQYYIAKLQALFLSVTARRRVRHGWGDGEGWL